MFSLRLLLCSLLLQVLTTRASPSVPVSTQAIVTTITAPTVSNSLSTSQTVFESTSTFEDIQTITTTDSSGNTITTTTDNGPTSTVFEITSNVVLTIPITAYITFVSTLGQTTILGPDPTTSVSTYHHGNTPSSHKLQIPTTASTTAAPTPSSPSVVNVSPAPAGSTETSTYISQGITYAPATTSSGDAGSTITSISSPTSSAYKGSPSFPSNTPQQNKAGGISTGAKAAIGTSAVVVCIFLAILLFWLDRLRRQRKAIREQYPAGQAPGDEAGIFGFFSPIVGKPYEKDGQDDMMYNNPAGITRKPSAMARELYPDDLTPPAVEAAQEQPYRRPIPQRNPHSPHSPISPVSPVHGLTPPLPPPEHRSYLPDARAELAAASDPFQKGFPRPLGRFPSHHATRSSGNVTALPEVYEKG